MAIGNPHIAAARVSKDCGPKAKGVFGQLAGKRRLPETSSFLDTDSVSKSLILRRFQKSGREFTEFREKCKAKFSVPPCLGQSPAPQKPRQQEESKAESFLLGTAPALPFCDPRGRTFAAALTPPAAQAFTLLLYGGAPWPQRPPALCRAAASWPVRARPRVPNR